ncbi:hypothetical protein B0H13DRAFT_2008690 [Mycena leptocephala]|nr:hypothetical protein B0H13DRAFT_2008690 [Mycena leptocephala]
MHQKEKHCELNAFSRDLKERLQAVKGEGSSSGRGTSTLLLSASSSRCVKSAPIKATSRRHSEQSNAISPNTADAQSPPLPMLSTNLPGVSTALVDQPDAAIVPKFYLPHQVTQPMVDSSANPEHHLALTRMVLSSHSLAVEHRRWQERGKPVVPREWRKCRFCQDSVEDPAHALFICAHPKLAQVRERFLTDLYAKIPEFQGAFADAMDFFRAVLSKREVTPILAKLAFNILRIYDATPMLLLDGPPPPGTEP